MIDIRIEKITAEMAHITGSQSAILDSGGFFTTMTQENVQKYIEQNDRLERLHKELQKLRP